MAEVNQLKAGVVLNYLSIGLHGLVTFLYTPYMLHKLGQSEYGLYSLVASVVGYMTLFDFGFGDALVRYTAKYRAESKTQEQYNLFGMFIIFYAVISVLVTLGGLLLYMNAPSLFGDTMTAIELERAKVLLLLLTFNLALSFLFQVYGAIIGAYERFVFSKTFSIIRFILNTIIMVMLLHMGYKAIAMVVVSTIFNIFTFLINYIYCKSRLKIKVRFGKFDRLLALEIAAYSFWIFLDVIMDKIYWSTGQFVLGAISGTVAVSVFALAIHLEGSYMVFSVAISGVFLPRVTSMIATNKSNHEISELFIRTGRLQFIVLAFILSGFVAFGMPFIRLWAGQEYEGSYYIALIFFITLLIPLIQNMGITILKARNQMKFRSLLYIVIAAVSFLAQIVLARQFGAIGCAIAIACALFVGQGVIMNIYYHKIQHLDIVRFWKEIGRMAIVPFFMSIAAILLFRYVAIDTWPLLFMCLTIYSACYIPCFWHFSMRPDERRLIETPVRRFLGR